MPDFPDCDCPDCEEIRSLRAERDAAPAEARVWREAVEELRGAFEHRQKVLAYKRSEFITENGRRGKSPWAELMDAVLSVLAAHAVVAGRGERE